MVSPKLSQIFLYPVKSCRGIPLSTSEVGARGLRWDRNWMIVDGDGQFLTQRQHPRMTLLRTDLRESALYLHIPDGAGILLDPGSPGFGSRKVRVWDDDLPAIDEGEGPASELSRFFRFPVRLVRIPPSPVRSTRFGASGRDLAFSDSAPLLLLSQGSLEDLNSRMATPVTMERFRPNLVVAGVSPFAEDGWVRVRIGKVEIAVVYPCTRCSIPTVDPDTGEMGKEPTRTLATYRRREEGVIFGQNAATLGSGRLSVGDRVNVLEEIS